MNTVLRWSWRLFQPSNADVSHHAKSDVRMCLCVLCSGLIRRTYSHISKYSRLLYCNAKLRKSASRWYKNYWIESNESFSIFVVHEKRYSQFPIVSRVDRKWPTKCGAYPISQRWEREPRTNALQLSDFVVGLGVAKPWKEQRILVCGAELLRHCLAFRSIDLLGSLFSSLHFSVNQHIRVDMLIT